MLIRGFCRPGPRLDPDLLRRRSTCIGSTRTIQNAAIKRVPLDCRQGLRARRGRRARGRRLHDQDRVPVLAEQPDGPIARARRRRAHLPRDSRAERSSCSTRRITSSPRPRISPRCGRATSTSCCCERCRSSCRSRACAADSLVARAGGHRVLAERAAAVHVSDALDRACRPGVVERLAARIRRTRRTAQTRARALVCGARAAAASCARSIRATRIS